MADIKSMICKRHGLTEFVLRSDGFYRCKKCASESVSERRRKLKEEIVKYKGGRCEICGYNKCIGALEFHHLDPDEKDFQISNGSPKTLEKLKKESDKCILVCSNCHREIHYNAQLEERKKKQIEESANIEKYMQENLHRRYNIVNTISKDEIAELSKTMTQKQVAEFYKISVSSVKRILKKQ